MVSLSLTHPFTRHYRCLSADPGEALAGHLGAQRKEATSPTQGCSGPVSGRPRREAERPALPLGQESRKASGLCRDQQTPFGLTLRDEWGGGPLAKAAKVSSQKGQQGQGRESQRAQGMEGRVSILGRSGHLWEQQKQGGTISWEGMLR